MDNAYFDDDGQFCCPTCSQAIPLDSVTPGEVMRCTACKTRFRCSKRSEFLFDAFRSMIRKLRRSPDAALGEAWVAVTTEGRLSGLSATRIRECLLETGKTDLEIEEYFELSDPLVQSGARVAGLQMFFAGLLFLIGFVGIAALLAWVFEAIGFIAIPIGGIAVSGVFMIVGLVKFFTGWNLH